MSIYEALLNLVAKLFDKRGLDVVSLRPDFFRVGKY
jgi:hypothetical protein